MEPKLIIKIPKDNDLNEYISSNESTPPPPPTFDDESPIPPPPSLDDKSPIPRPPLDDSLFDLSDDNISNYQYISDDHDIISQTNQESPYGFELSIPTLITSNHIVSEYITSEHTKNKENSCLCYDSILCSIIGLIICTPIIIILLPFYGMYMILKFIF